MDQLNKSSNDHSLRLWASVNERQQWCCESVRIHIEDTLLPRCAIYLPAPLCRRVGGGSGVTDSIGIDRVNRCANLARRNFLRQQLDHDTRDLKTDASSRSHAIEDNGAIRIYPFDVTVSIVPMTIFEVTAAEAGHKAHEVTVDNLKLIERLNIASGLSDKGRPDDL